VIAIYSEPGLGQVDPYQQTTPYSCGPAALLAVMRHLGDYRLSEPELMALVGAKPEVGSSVIQVVNAARFMGMRSAVRQFSSLDEAKKWTDAGVPVIAGVASFRLPGKRHFVVITAVDAINAFLMDPNTPGNRRILSRSEMDSRWKDATGYDRLGVVVWRPQMAMW